MAKYIDELINRYSLLQAVKSDVEKAYEIIKESYEAGGKLLVGGNGGSCADSEHIVGELMKGFVKRRPIDKRLKEKLENMHPQMGEALSNGLQSSLRAIALTSHQALSTAFANDVDAEMIFAQQVFGYGDERDVLLAISTSGNAKNLMYAAMTAKAKGMKIIALSGKTGGKLKDIADVSIIVPLEETYQIQELHLPIYHALCLELENYFFEI